MRGWPSNPSMILIIGHNQFPRHVSSYDLDPDESK